MARSGPLRCAVALLALACAIPATIAARVLAPRPEWPRLAPDVAGRVLDLVPFRFSLATVGARAVTFWGPEGVRGQFEIPTSIGAAFFPDGRRVLVWGDDRRSLRRIGTDGRVEQAVIWDMHSGEALRNLRYERHVEIAKVFPAGDRVLLCGGSGRCRVWDAYSGAVTRFFRAEVAWRVEISPLGDRLLVYRSRSKFSVLNAAAPEVICESPDSNASEESEDVPSDYHDVAMFPDWGRLVTSQIESEVAMIWSTRTCAPLMELVNPWPIWNTAVLDRGSIVVCAGFTFDPHRLRSGATVWSAASGQKLRDLMLDPIKIVEMVPFVWPDCLLVQAERVLSVWNATSGEVLQQFSEAARYHVEIPDEGGRRSLAVASGGEVIASCGGGEIIVWDVPSGAKIHAFNTTGRDHTVGLFLGGASDPGGVGRGLSWRELRRHRFREPPQQRFHAW